MTGSCGDAGRRVDLYSANILTKVFRFRVVMFFPNSFPNVSIPLVDWVSNSIYLTYMTSWKPRQGETWLRYFGEQ